MILYIAPRPLRVEVGLAGFPGIVDYVQNVKCTGVQVFFIISPPTTVEYCTFVLAITYVKNILTHIRKIYYT